MPARGGARIAGALVTGGAKRVGRAISVALANAGYAVAIHHRGGAEDAAALVQEIEAKGGVAAAVQGDLSDASAISPLFDEAARRVGPLTLLVNNASHFDDDRIETLTQDSFRAHMGPDLLAPLLLIQAFAEAAAALPADADPSVVNILDQRVLRPNPQFLSYTLAKSSLYTATQTLAQALAPRIRVNGVGPGPTLPSIHQDQAAFDAEVAGILLKRQTALSDVTDAVLYLAAAKAVTGQMIAVDGGQHLGWKTPDILPEIVDD
jgi:NAD(P)-dependent dehydrogenase (short-subunit alcohol dehydrogenase family)